MRQANEDGTASTWVTLSKFLPLLAEAAPDALLAALRKCIAQQHPFAQRLLEGAASEMGWSFAPSELIDVRSALEILAWSADYFAAAVSVHWPNSSHQHPPAPLPLYMGCSRSCVRGSPRRSPDPTRDFKRWTGFARTVRRSRGL